MKPIIQSIVILFLLLFANTFAQRSNTDDNFGRMSAKIEQLEKIKIIEELNLDEETILIFFAKRNQHRENQKLLIERKENLFKNLNKSFNSDDKVNYNDKLNEIFNIEKKMLTQREEFFNSLSSILTPKQIVQLNVFEFKFRNEVRNQFIKAGKRRSKDR
jgi:Spy/CpxP family protein refolding chaperone